MVREVKTKRNQIMRFILGNPLLTAPGVDVDGWPKQLSFLKHLHTTPKGIRSCLTLLMLTRAFSLGGVPKLDTITDKTTGYDCISEPELLSAFSKLKLVKGCVGEWAVPHMTTKKGPQGQALLTSLNELTLLPRFLRTSIEVLGGRSLSEFIESNVEALDILEAIKPKGTSGFFSISKWWITLFPTRSTSLRKLSYFPDKEDKVRVIALLDYWSQSALRPLHLTCNKLLRRIPTDMTFNQDAFSHNVLPTLPDNNSYHSIDLSAATDRMPIALQCRLVEHLYGSAEKCRSWYTILVGLPFIFTDLKTKHSQPVVYGAGQPMGAYSSWPVMALTHHIIVQVAAIRAGITRVNSRVPFRSYVLLGDDLRIDDDLVASEYKSLISTLGMPYSEEKTHTSKDGFEFAKRWFFRGEEVTGFAVSGLLSVWKSYPLLINFLDNQSSHGWTLPLEGHPVLISQIVRALAGKHFIINKTASMIKLYNLFAQVRTFKKGPKGMQEDSILVSTEAFLGTPLPSVLIDNKDKHIINLVYLLAKKNLVERDLLTFQKEAYKVNARLNGFVSDKIKKARVDKPTADFLKETLSTVLNWSNPLVMVLNRQIDLSLEFLMNYWDPDQSDDFLFQEGLSKYSLTKGVFTMRSSTSICLAESAILKAYISVVKNLFDENHADYKALISKLKELEHKD